MKRKSPSLSLTLAHFHVPDPSFKLRFTVTAGKSTHRVLAADVPALQPLTSPTCSHSTRSPLSTSWTIVRLKVLWGQDCHSHTWDGVILVDARGCWEHTANCPLQSLALTGLDLPTPILMPALRNLSNPLASFPQPFPWHSPHFVRIIVRTTLLWPHCSAHGVSAHLWHKLASSPCDYV